MEALYKEPVTIHKPRKLDIACGKRKTEGFTGIDLAGDADIVHDLFKFPWPIAANSVREARVIHFVEHIPHQLEGPVDGWFQFWDEVYRITRKGATVEVVHPYAKSDRAFWDPTHVRYINETTWYYLDRNWREMQELDHYPVKADFEIVVIEGTGIATDIAGRAAEVQDFARSHYWNVLADLRVVLKRR